MSTSNHVDDNNYWEPITRGFDFSEDSESREDEDADSKFFGISRAAALKKTQELQAEVSSLQSFSSDASSEETPSNAIQRIRDLPGFLWTESSGIEAELDRQLMVQIHEVKKGIYFPDQDVLRSATERPVHDQHHVAPATLDETIFKLLVGGSEVPLEHFKSLSQKKALLQKAIEINDGNSILAATLFISKTLRPNLFRQVLLENPAAANHYIRYLELKNEVAHLVDLLNMLGRTSCALMHRYKQILKKEGNLPCLHKEMEHFLKAECHSEEDVACCIQQHLQLLQIHKEVKEKKDNSFQHEKYGSVLKTLEYVARNHYDSSTSATTLLSVEGMRKQFTLSVKQFSWVVLQALVRQQKWPQIENLLVSKSWLRGSKDKCLLPLEDVCRCLHDAPVDLTARFVRLIDDVDKRLAIAKKLKCHMVVIDTYASIKDRAGILSYRSNLEEHSKDAIHADNTLKSGIKWKN